MRLNVHITVPDSEMYLLNVLTDNGKATRDVFFLRIHTTRYEHGGFDGAVDAAGGVGGGHGNRSQHQIAKNLHLVMFKMK